MVLLTPGNFGKRAPEFSGRNVKYLAFRSEVTLHAGQVGGAL